MLKTKRAELASRRQELRGLLTSSLERAAESGRTEANAREIAMQAEMKKLDGAQRQLDARVRHAEQECQRAGNPQFGMSRRERSMGTTAGQLAPLQFGDEQLRRLQTAAQRGESARVETRDFSSSEALLPAGLFPGIVGAQHESRLLDRLPGVLMETSSIEFIRHISTSGEAGATAEGALKPELILHTDALTAVAVKIAAHTATSYEVMSDHVAFADYVNSELARQVVDIENLLLLQGGDAAVIGSTGTTVEPAGPSGMTGFLSTPGILHHNAAADTGADIQSLDSIEIAIAEMRIGPALATPNLLVLAPNTWSAMRRIKDGQNRYLVAPDPTTDEAQQLWGVEVLTTTEMPSGKGLLLDTAKCGYVGIREPLSLRLGFSGDDFSRNLIRTVCEERLVLAVTRPPAVMLVEGLPT